jgi:hypothetical protein
MIFRHPFRRNPDARRAGEERKEREGALAEEKGPADRSDSLGLTAPIAVLMAGGTLLVALADAAAREGRSSKESIFWAGITLIVVPVAVRLCAPGPSRRERIWLVVLFGVGLYLAKVTYSPTRLTFSDEFVHLRSVRDDLLNGHLFSFNPLLPEAARYPGLGDLASALVRLTGLPVATAGLIVVGAARIVLMLAIFLVVERLSGSARLAGLACLLYGANPNFLYWSAQFSYESVALPLVAFTLYLVMKRSAGGESRVRESWRLGALMALCILAVVVTHHLSSYFLAGVLAVWSAVILFRRHRLGRPSEYNPILLALLALAAIGAWLLAVAPITGQYLGSIASSTGEGLFNVLTGASTTRALFTSGAEVAPLWERLLSVLSVLLTLLALAYGAYLIWRRRRPKGLMLAPLILGLAYPLLLPLRFIGSAAETANRSTEFLFLGLGAVLATAAVELRARPRSRGGLVSGLVGALAALVVLGGVAVSWQYSERLPQSITKPGAPYELGIKAVEADRWAAANLGTGRRFASDFLDHLGLATYGLERPLWAPDDGISAWQILAPPSTNASVRRAIRLGRVEYVMVERKLSQGIPTSGFYFDKGEPEAGKYKQPISAVVLAKFDQTGGASRVYDNGEQQIYSVAGVGE